MHDVYISFIKEYIWMIVDYKLKSFIIIFHKPFGF
ncbi:hypothetical protein [Acidiplasma sp.]